MLKIVLFDTLRINRLVIIILLMTSYAVHLQAQVNATVEVADTAEVEDNPYAVKKDATIIPVDSAKLRGDENYEIYVMDKRFLPIGDSLGKRRWYQDFFLQMGLGGERIVPPTDGHKFNTLTTVQFGIGKQLGRYHSLRLLGQAALGYQQYHDRMYLRLGGMLDHMFDLTTYVYGYNPARQVGLSTIVGVGLGWARVRGTGMASYPYDVHAGLQFRFYTGPHGMVNVEPYIGLASDDIDLSQTKNWHRYDITYGVNMNFVYYFDDHLTRATRKRLINNLKDNERDQITGEDSLSLYSWQKPWIFEFAGGPATNNSPELESMETLGHEVAIGVGKWFSPVIGIRGTLMTRHFDWAKKLTYGDPLHTDNHNTYEQRMSAFYVGGRVEAMINPLGFFKSFRWDAPFGAYLVGGAGIGWFIKHRESPSLHTWSESYSAGLHLWARLADGLQLFVEPRITHNTYNVPFRNVQWANNYSDNTYGVNIGVTAMNIEHRYRKYETDDPVNMSRFTVGIGGGTNLSMPISRYIGSAKMGYNGGAFVEYHINDMMGVRLSFDYLSHSRSAYTPYMDLNMNLPQLNYSPVKRNGLWTYTYNMGLIGLDYSLNLTNALCGYRQVGPRGRLFNLELFAGPGLAMHLSQKAEIDSRENIRENHEVKVLYPESKGMYFAINGGVKLSAHVTQKIAVTLTPQIYYVPNLEFPAIPMTRMKSLEMVDLGVQYQF
jgi:hypothetical protein